jgi:hypothetical protein
MLSTLPGHHQLPCCCCCCCCWHCSHSCLALGLSSHSCGRRSSSHHELCMICPGLCSQPNWVVV